MPRIFSLHHYRLKAGVSRRELVQAFGKAKELGYLALPGLQTAHLLWGLKGEQKEQPAALWIYESQQAWEQLWGPPEAPIGPEQYPEGWRRWERELLAPLIIGDPDKVALTSFLTLDSALNRGGGPGHE